MVGRDRIERRDPASGLLRLGATLAGAGRCHKSGELRIEDQGQVHLIRLVRGMISEVVSGELNRSEEPSARHRAEQLFDLPRPLVTFDEAHPRATGLLAVHSDQVVFTGVLRRTDLFDPRPLVERIPVDALRLTDTGLGRLQGLRFSSEEKRFIAALARPTPTTMALWKRGLSPRHAAAMVIALNLLDCFHDWEAGDLPRVSAAETLRRKIRHAAPDHDILGVAPDADIREVDRAFRKLSFLFHPDRRQDLPEPERAAADAAFRGIVDAHHRLTNRRRKRPVVHRDAGCEVRPAARSAEPWRPLLEQSRQAQRAGNRRRAQVLALKALAAGPPPEAVADLKALLRAVA